MPQGSVVDENGKEIRHSDGYDYSLVQCPHCDYTRWNCYYYSR